VPDGPTRCIPDTTDELRRTGPLLLRRVPVVFVFLPNSGEPLGSAPSAIMDQFLS